MGTGASRARDRYAPIPDAPPPPDDSEEVTLLPGAVRTHPDDPMTWCLTVHPELVDPWMIISLAPLLSPVHARQIKHSREVHIWLGEFPSQTVADRFKRALDESIWREPKTPINVRAALRKGSFVVTAIPDETWAKIERLSGSADVRLRALAGDLL